MKHIWLFAAVFVFVEAASATPLCMNGTLAAYEALGAGGCSISSNIVASFMNVSGSTGATEISPTLVNIMPGGSTANPSLTFTVSTTANSGSLDEEIFTYIISGAVYSKDMSTLSGSSETGNGGVTDVQNYCAGGTFNSTGVAGCTTPATGTLLSIDGIQNSDSISLAGPQKVSITEDLTIDSGGTGSASGGTVEDQFTASAATPEPAGFLLTFLGLALIGGGKFRLVNRKA